MPDSREVALLAAEAMEDKRADDVLVLDVGRQTPVADYFVIGSAQTSVQIRAIVDGVEESLSTAGALLLNREGDAFSRWVLLDFGGVVIHVFGSEARRYYTLERLWADAPILER